MTQKSQDSELDVQLKLLGDSNNTTNVARSKEKNNIMTHDEFIEFLTQTLLSCKLVGSEMPMELCWLIISFLPRAKLVGEADIPTIMVLQGKNCAQKPDSSCTQGIATARNHKHEVCVHKCT